MTATLITRIRYRVHIRWMIRRDLPALAVIEDALFPDSWGDEDFIAALRQRNAIGMVAEVNEQILGGMVYSLHKHRLDLLRLAVHPDQRRGGVGTQMVQKLIGKLASHRRTAITAAVPETSLDALLFLRALGFKAERVERGGSGEPDVIHLAWHLRDEEEL